MQSATAALAEANKKLEILSNLDGLTGLPNRRKFDVFYQSAWQQACEKAEPLAVILMDVDWFKDLNDQYGHQAGDDCLRRIARILAQVPANSQEIAARYGGEEFVIVLLGLDGQRALSVAQSIGKAIENEAIAHNKGARPAQAATLSRRRSLLSPNSRPGSGRPA